MEINNHCYFSITLDTEEYRTSRLCVSSETDGSCGDLLPKGSMKNGLSYEQEIEIDGKIIPGLQAYAGLAREIEVIEYRNGDASSKKSSDPTDMDGDGYPFQFQNLVLTRDGAHSLILTRWHEQMQDGLAPKNIKIIRRNSHTRVALIKEYEGCIPVQWISPASDRSESTEVIELVDCRIVKRGKGQGHFSLIK